MNKESRDRDVAPLLLIIMMLAPFVLYVALESSRTIMSVMAFSTFLLATLIILVKP